MSTAVGDVSSPSSAVTVPSSVSSSSSSGQNVALIAGVTGIVGASLVELLLGEGAPGGPWKVYGIARRRPQGKWLRPHCESLEYVQCDLLSKEDTETKLAPFRKGVTHVFYVTWTSRPTEEENCEANGSMLRHVLDAVVGHAPGLSHVCLQTGIKHYLGSHFGFDAERTRVGEVYEEGAPRCEGLNFYYVQEDILTEKLQGRGVTWSVHRPGLILGLSPHSLVNAALALAVYACICRREGRQLAFTGTCATWGSHLEASDADLIAAQEVWAATEPAAANQAFNAANGATTTWAELWPAIARSFGTDPAPFDGHPQSFVALMRDKAPVWDAIVREHGLVPTKIEDFLGGWQILDITLQKLPAGKSSMEKSRLFGFHEKRDTKESFLYWFDKMRERKLIP